MAAVLAQLFLQSLIFGQKAQTVADQFSTRILAGGEHEYRDTDDRGQAGCRAIRILRICQLREPVGTAMTPRTVFSASSSIYAWFAFRREGTNRLVSSARSAV